MKVYEQSPCSLCRESAIQDLIKRNQAPDWLLQECLADCVKETRAMAKAELENMPGNQAQDLDST